jgi:hypothetical protein
VRTRKDINPNGFFGKKWAAGSRFGLNGAFSKFFLLNKKRNAPFSTTFDQACMAKNIQRLMGICIDRKAHLRKPGLTLWHGSPKPVCLLCPVFSESSTA